jgi:endo-1,4-beta-xylanase
MLYRTFFTQVYIALVSLTQIAYSQGLGELAEKYNLHIGSCVSHFETYDPMFLKTLIREFDTWNTGWESTWSQIHPERDRYNFAEVDNLVRMAEKYHKSLIWRGDLLWMGNHPSWLASDNPSGSINQITHFNREELLSILDDHIETVMGRYKGKFSAWYIANEVIESPYFNTPPWNFDNYTTEMRHTFWYDSIGPDYLAHAFRKAHEVDPDAKLFINEGFWWMDTPGLARVRCDFFYNLVDSLLKQGVPLDGVGLIYYAQDSFLYPKFQGCDWTQRKEEIQRFTDLGIEVQLSEVGAVIKSPFTNKKRQHQAELFQKTLDLCLQNKKVTTMTIFEFSDKAIFVPSEESWYVFDRDIEPLPAYYALQHRLLGDTTMYQHNFEDPQVNPRITVPDMDWGVKPLVSSRYKILTSNYNGTGSWNITNGNTVLATLQPGNEFWINISKLPTDKAYWNDSDYFHISISGDGFFNGPHEGGYSFYDRDHFIRGVDDYPGTPEWLRKIIPAGSRLIWDDWISNFQDHSEYGYSDLEPTFTNTDTTIGFHVKNEKMSLSTEWNKKSGALTYYHYTGTAVAGQLPLDLEFVLKSDVHSGINTSVEPEKLILAQNFPNPFTSSTVIEYSIPKAAFVSLKVYDIFGCEVASLVEENKQPGKYRVSWNASKMPGGVFFYRLQSGSYTESKRLLLLK